MGFFTSKREKLLEAQLKALQSQNILSSVASATNIFPNWQSSKETELYRTVDDLYSIVTFLAETAAIIPFFGYKVVKDEAMKRYKSATGIHKRYYATKALVDLPENNTTVDFLAKLTYETKVQIYLNLFLNGETFIYLEKIDIGPNAGKLNPHILPGQNISIIVTDYWPQTVVGYRYKDSKFDFKMEATEVIHIKYFNPDHNQNQFRGLSPIAALQRRITRINAGMSASVAQIQNGGLPGVIYEKALTGGDLNKRKEDFGNYLSNHSNTGAPYWIDGELGYIQTGTPLADMQVAELSDIDFKKLCNAFRMPSQLLNNDKASTDNNMGWAEKRLYTNAIVPNIIRLRDGLNKGLLLSVKAEYIEYDTSGVPALQSDMKTEAEALKIMDWITPNEKREIQKFDRSDNPIMDEIIIGNSSMLITDLEFTEDNEATKDYAKR